ncbi:Transcriptional regulator, contains HTH domain [Halalkaliarchaeum sp. AArc-CO]|uniref:helix-turn-helix domain-containing protein n=1 Tax=unclassified Halalkaliarchaeum TaxID=2678344 RepID=UPI00217EC11D|nr:MULTISPECIES: helix-turn-helix domain-containing protein [unclassified Halalkaliarchaeum]MDR5673255.1 helix-turn-helix domain-containing protein [Halalkaliarchaeum sp. AArc-GB]UWG51785.1 Transcriptional regulator, contains HTH domain [Halalkaliarchaeum sp. AArc-CO]
MVSLDVGTNGTERPRLYECSECTATLIASRDPDGVVCCGEPMTRVDRVSTPLQDPDLEAVLEEVLGLSRNTIVVCIYVMERGPTTVPEIAEDVGLSESAVSTKLTHLVEAGILERSQRNLTNGGSVNVYTAVSAETQRRIYRRGLYQWFREAIELIDEFDLEELKERYRKEESETETDTETELSSVYWDSDSSVSSSD